MREREAASRVALAVPPPELRQFTDPSRPGCRDEDLGVNVYSDRAAWLAARRRWEAASGITMREWLDELFAEMAEGGASLTELNVAFSMYLVEDDDWSDPRLWQPGQPAA